MGRVIAQVNYSNDFKNDVPRAEKRKVAEQRKDIPGFLWKIWLRDEKAKRGGGIFLFEDRASAEAWLASRAHRKPDASTTDLTVELFDVDEELSLISGGPIEKVREAV
ncbi:MAG: YdhR family protein [Pseudorhodoplanes sp.]